MYATSKNSSLDNVCERRFEQKRSVEQTNKLGWAKYSMPTVLMLH